MEGSYFRGSESDLVRKPEIWVYRNITMIPYPETQSWNIWLYSLEDPRFAILSFRTTSLVTVQGVQMGEPRRHTL